MPPPLKVCLIGHGAIGSAVCRLLDGDASLRIAAIVVPPHHRPAPALDAPTRRFVHGIDWQARPDVVLECAGHAAIRQHVLPALRAGIPCIVASVGALAEPGMVEQLEDAARAGHTTLQLIAGAIGAIDALAAARIGGLERVRYEGRKPPRAWQGTPAEDALDLERVHAPVCFFEGSAREAALRFPRNANVAATVALAGLGLDGTQVALYADPTVQGNQHRLQAAGAFGSLELTLTGNPLAANPKTSALTVYSAVRALTQRSHAIAI